MEFAVIDNNRDHMKPETGRGRGFVQSLAAWHIGKDYEFIRYDQVKTRMEEVRRCQGLILSGSRFDFARTDDAFESATYQKMAPEFELIRDFDGPVLGICFGHQLLALAEEFDAGRSAFGCLRIRNMQDPEDAYLVTQVRLTSRLRFADRDEFWAQYNHKQEVAPNEALRHYYDIIAGTDRCQVEIMQHKSREWFGVQFHPEVGKESGRGEVKRHDAAVADGQALISDFVRYCLR